MLSSATRALHFDHLGSLDAGRPRPAFSQSSAQTGAPMTNSTSMPYGYEVNPQLTTNDYKFTGLERDAETGPGNELDHAFFRQYSPRLGRWMSPDPAGLAAVDMSNPQTWNRYAYVAGNPTNAIDPLGLCPAPGVDSKHCIYVQRIGNNSYGCTIDTVSAPCGLALSLVRGGAAYPESFGGSACNVSNNGNVYCGNPEVAQPFNPVSYLASLPSQLTQLIPTEEEIGRRTETVRKDGTVNPGPILTPIQATCAIAAENSFSATVSNYRAQAARQFVSDMTPNIGGASIIGFACRTGNWELCINAIASDLAGNTINTVYKTIRYGFSEETRMLHDANKQLSADYDYCSKLNP